MMIENGFKDRLKKLRKTMGLTQIELAEIIGVGQSYIGNIERIGGNLNIEQLNKLFHHLNVNLIWLIAGKGNMFIEQEEINIQELKIKQLKSEKKLNDIEKDLEKLLKKIRE